MKNILIVFCSVFLFSCSNNENKSISLDEVSKGSERYKENKSNDTLITKKNDEFKNLSLFSKEIIDTLKFEINNIYLTDTSLFADRFGALYSEKWYMKNNEDSFTYYHWRFKDSNNCYSTLYNLLDCFGSKCKNYKIGNDKKFYFNRGVLMLINNSNFWILESNKTIDLDLLIYNFYSKNKLEKWKYIVFQDVRKKTKWYYQENINSKIEIIEKTP